MRKSKPYNGHHCWNCWNVFLWIGNDEGLYRAARDYVLHVKPCALAVDAFLNELAAQGITETPDGAKYTKSAVRKAMVAIA